MPMNEPIIINGIPCVVRGGGIFLFLAPEVEYCEKYTSCNDCPLRYTLFPAKYSWEGMAGCCSATRKTVDELLALVKEMEQED